MRTAWLNSSFRGRAALVRELVGYDRDNTHRPTIVHLKHIVSCEIHFFKVTHKTIYIYLTDIRLVLWAVRTYIQTYCWRASANAFDWCPGSVRFPRLRTSIRHATDAVQKSARMDQSHSGVVWRRPETVKVTFISHTHTLICSIFAPSSKQRQGDVN